MTTDTQWVKTEIRRGSPVFFFSIQHFAQVTIEGLCGSSSLLGERARDFMEMVENWHAIKEQVAGIDMECFGSFEADDPQERYRLAHQLGSLLNKMSIS